MLQEVKYVIVYVAVSKTSENKVMLFVGHMYIHVMNYRADCRY